jgi:hypothetical protein
VHKNDTVTGPLNQPAGFADRSVLAVITGFVLSTFTVTCPVAQLPA